MLVGYTIFYKQPLSVRFLDKTIMADGYNETIETQSSIQLQTESWRHVGGGRHKQDLGRTVFEQRPDLRCCSTGVTKKLDGQTPSVCRQVNLKSYHNHFETCRPYNPPKYLESAVVGQLTGSSVSVTSPIMASNHTHLELNFDAGALTHTHRQLPWRSGTRRDLKSRRFHSSCNSVFHTS